MATDLFPITTEPNVGLATDNANLRGTNLAWAIPDSLSTARGSSTVNAQATTVLGTTLGVECGIAAGPREWISEAVAADVTISGTITFNIWCFESSMSANAGPQIILDVIRANTFNTRNSNTIDNIINSEEGVECGTSSSLHSWTGTPTSTVVKRGDRFRLRMACNDAGGTMASGFTFSIAHNGPTAGASGDTFVRLTENVTFESAPAGSTIYLTDVASDVNPGAAVEKEAWTSRGSGATTKVTNTAAGYVSNTQIPVTDGGGGSTIEWYTKRLQAVTLGGLVKANIRMLASVAAHTAARCEIAVVNSDGSSPTIWGSWALGQVVGTTEGNVVMWPSGEDTSVADGQRLRIRIYLEDPPERALTASETASIVYGGTSGGASGDTFLTFQQALTEFIPPADLQQSQPLLMTLSRR